MVFNRNLFNWRKHLAGSFFSDFVLPVTATNVHAQNEAGTHLAALGQRDLFTNTLKLFGEWN